jgi:hypothetical protein
VTSLDLLRLERLFDLESRLRLYRLSALSPPSHHHTSRAAMFTSSVRRAAFAVQPSPIVASISAAVPRAAASQTLSCRSTQRRYSSSKPSNADGPKGVVSGSPSVPAPAARAEAKKAKGKGAKKAKDVVERCTVKARDEAFQKLPSVPSTAHVQGKGMSISLSEFILDRFPRL